MEVPEMAKVREKYGKEYSEARYRQMIKDTVFSLNFPEPEKFEGKIAVTELFNNNHKGNQAIELLVKHLNMVEEKIEPERIKA